MESWKMQDRFSFVRPESLGGTEVPLLHFVQQGGFRAFCRLMDIIRPRIKKYDLVTLPVLFVDTLAEVMREALESGNMIYFEEIGANLTIYHNSCALINMDFEAFIPVLMSMNVAPPPLPNDQAKIMTKTVIELLKKEPIDTGVVVMGCGHGGKEFDILKDKNVVTTYVDKEVTDLKNQIIARDFKQGDMNDHCAHDFITTYIFIATLGYLSDVNLVGIQVKGHRIIGLAYVADFLNSSTNPCFRRDVHPHTIVGRIGNYKDISERPRYFDSFFSNQVATPTFFFNPSYVKTPHVDGWAMLRSQVVVHARYPVNSDFPSQDGRCFRLKWIRRVATPPPKKPSVFPYIRTTHDLLTKAPFYVTDKTDGFPFYMGAVEYIGGKQLILTDKMYNQYIVMSTDFCPVVPPQGFKDQWVEAYTTPDGTMFYPIIDPQQVISGNYKALCDMALNVATSNGVLSQKRYLFVDPGSASQRDYGLVFGADGMIFYPAYGTKAFYFKAIHTKDVPSDVGGSTVVIESYYAGDLPSCGRIRFDKDPINSRTDTHDSGFLAYSFETSIKKISYKVGDNDRVTEYLVSAAMEYGSSVLTFSYVWRPLQDNYAHLHPIDPYPMSDYATVLKQIRPTLAHTGFYESDVKIEMVPFITSIYKDLHNRGMIEIKYIGGLMRYCYTCSDDNFYNPNISRDPAGNYKKHEHRPDYAFPVGYTGQNLKILTFSFNPSIQEWLSDWGEKPNYPIRDSRHIDMSAFTAVNEFNQKQIKKEHRFVDVELISFLKCTHPNQQSDYSF